MTLVLPTLLIVGGGYAGAALTIRLLEAGGRPLRLVIAEPRAELGRGQAYGGTEAVHLVNGPASNFSIHPQDPEHLARWLEANAARLGLSIPPEGADRLFIPRPLFGRYVGEALRRAVAEAPAGFVVEHRRAEVVSLRREDAGLTAIFADGSALRADKAALATGVFPLAPDPALADLAGTERLATPWDSEALDRLARGGGDLLIVGASLSMVDAVASLEARGYRGRYRVLSRRGHLIEGHRETSEPVPILDEDALPRTARALLSAVVRARREILARGGDWQSLPFSLKPYLLRLWLGASNAERLRFVRHLRALWDVTAHRAAPASYAAVEAARAEGRFQAQAARLVSAGLEADGVRVAFRPRGARRVETATFDAILDARGHQEHDWRRIRAPLAQDLLHGGLARPHETGFGLDATIQGEIFDARGQVWGDLFAIGHPLRGVAWESSSLTEQKAQALALAGLLRAEFAAEEGAARALSD